MIGLECIVKLRTAELAPPLLTLPLIEYCQSANRHMENRPQFTLFRT